MPTIKLTDLTVRKRQGPDEIWDASVPNFGLRIGTPNERWPKGRKTWQVMYRVNGNKKRHKLGNYPEMSLADARKQASDAISLARQGIDVKEVRQEQQDQAAFTVSKQFRTYSCETV